MSQAVINYILSGVALVVTLYLGWSQHQANKRQYQSNEWTRQMVGEIHEMHVELHDFLKEAKNECDVELPLLSGPEQHSKTSVHKTARILPFICRPRGGEISESDFQEVERVYDAKRMWPIGLAHLDPFRDNPLSDSGGHTGS